MTTFKEQLAKYFDGTLNVTKYGNIADWITFNVTDMSEAFPIRISTEKSCLIYHAGW